MTISSSVAKSGPYNGNGATTSFSYGFKIIAESHIEVILTDADAVETVQTITTDYTVTGVGDANGGSVVMVTAPATGELLTLKLHVPLTQEVDLENQGAFFAETIEAAFDKVTQIVVQQQEVIDRCVQVDISSGDDPADFLDSIDAAVSAASASASSASTSAGTATTQAGLAATAKTAAETAETNAETAQAAAEAARDLAQGYATAADVAKIEWQGAWVTSTAYALNDAVSQGGSSYICIVAHTSGTFATDLAALKWEVLAQKGTDGAGSGNMTNTGTPSAGQIPKYSDTSGTAIAPGYTVDTDTTLAANSDSNVATQKAVKAYVDTATASAGKPAFKNLLIGGSALTNPWQLGTSVAVSGTTLTYGPDRWFGKGGAAGSAYTMSQQASSVTASPYCFRVQRTASNTDTSVITFGQVVETINAKSLQGKTVTLSFQARSGANFSAASSYLVSTISTGTGADQGSSSLIAGTWTGQANTAQNNTLTTSFQTFTQTITVPSTATELAVRLSFTPVGTAGAADYFELLDVQLEVGSSASSFEALPEDVVLARCQRYYSKTYDQGVSPGSVNLNSAITSLSVGTAVNSVNLFWQYPVRMRASPTVTIYSPNTGATGQMRRNAGAADVAAVPYNQGSCAVTAYNNAIITSGDMHWAHMTASAEL